MSGDTLKISTGCALYIFIAGVCQNSCSLSNLRTWLHFAPVYQFENSIDDINYAINKC